MNQVKLYQKVQEIKNRIKSLEEEIETSGEDLIDLYQHCKHESTEPKEHYSPGGYEHCAKSSYWDECILCGEHLNVKTENYNYYG